MAGDPSKNRPPAAIDARKPLFQGLIRGLLPLYLLIALRERPRHGTELIRSLAEMSGETWRPSPGSVYPVLRRLEKQGLLSGRWQRGQAAPKRVYRLTKLGRESLPDLEADLLDQLRLARDLIDRHIEALDPEGRTREGDEHGLGNGDGDGHVNGLGLGNGNGDGDGNGHEQGHGNGLGNGLGNGHGQGHEQGLGNGNGNGLGDEGGGGGAG